MMINGILGNLEHIDLDKDDSDDDFICLDCIKDNILKSYNRKLHHERVCCECHKEIKDGFSVSYLTSKFKENLSYHYSISDDDSGMPLFDVVFSFLGKKEISNRVSKELLKKHSNKSAKYVAIKDNMNETDVIKEWNEINFNLMHSNRFFNKTVEDFFSSIVSLAYHFVHKDNHEDRLAVSRLNAGSKLYRARKITINGQASILTDPVQSLGPAPYDKAANNRMSAEAIPMLYLANDLETSISEIRPSMGDVLAIGEFITLKDLVFFDFRKIEKEISDYSFGESILFKKNERQYIIEKFLPFVGNEICKPVNNSRGYIASQALTEVIRNFHAGNIFDGVIFKSVQNREGINYVIFNKTRYNENIEVSCDDFHVKLNEDTVFYKKIMAIEYMSQDCVFT